MDMPKKGMSLDTAATWSNFVAHADQIDDAFIRDIKETK